MIEQTRDRPYKRTLIIGLQDAARLHTILATIPRSEILYGWVSNTDKETVTCTIKIKKEELLMIKLSIKVLETKKEKGIKRSKPFKLSDFLMRML